MKLLLTGAGGFIGSYFRARYKNKYSIQQFSFSEDKIDCLDCHNVDIVFHLSALSYQAKGEHIDMYEKINVIQTLDLAKKAKSSGVKQFVFMSTIKVYGEGGENKYNEASDCKPEDGYGKSKLRAERELKKLETDNFKISIIRPPIVYGYEVRGNIKLIIGLVSKIPFLPLGRICNRRSMVYVGNLCHLVDEVIRQGKAGVFLANDDGVISTSELCLTIANHLNKRIILFKLPFLRFIVKVLNPGFHRRLYGDLEIDNSITMKCLNLSNPYSIEEGVRLMIEGE